MTSPHRPSVLAGPSPVRIEIGTLTVRAASGIEARRLADALPAAIGRALAGGLPGHSAADRVAVEVVNAVRARLFAGGPS